jgi:hypothetical protein
MSTQAPEAPVTETPPAPQTDPTPAQPAAEPQAPAQAPAQAQPAAQQPAPKPSPPPDGRQPAPIQPQASPADGDPSALKAERDKLTTELAKVKAEADRWKQQSRTQEQRSKANHAELKNRDALLREIAAKVGVEFDDKPDPEELTRKLEAAQATAKAKSVELAVYHSAATTGANAAALLDSREFMSRTAALDPDAGDFPAAVADLVAGAAQQARYQVAQAPVLTPQVQQAPAQHQPADNFQQPPAATSGADFSGAPGGNRKWTQADYLNYMATSNTEDRDGKKLEKAINDGLLADIGVGKPKRKSRR